MSITTNEHESPFISIIIPVYNSEKYLERLLLCITTVVLTKSYETIIIDDCSTDLSYKTLKKYVTTYKNLRLYQTSSNIGPSGTRNLGIHYSRGKYIFFLDADDTIEMNCLSTLSNSFSSDSASHQVVLTDSRWMIPSGINIRDGMYSYDIDSEFKNESLTKVLRDRFYSLKRKGILSCKAKLISREFLFKHSVIFEENVRYLEDEIFMWDVLGKATSVKYLRSQLHTYFVNPNTSSGVSDGLLKDFSFQIFELIQKKVQTCFLSRGLSYKESNLISNQAVVYFFINILLSCAKSVELKKISRENGSSFVRDLIKWASRDAAFNLAVKTYKYCDGESMQIVIILKLGLWSFLKPSIFARAKNIIKTEYKL